MPYRSILPAIVLLVAVSSTQAVEPSELKPGLATTYTEYPDGPSGTVVTRLEPTVAFMLGAGETPHPRMRVNGLTRWQGYINIVRTGKYTFSATVQGGSLTVKVNGTTVLFTPGLEALTTTRGAAVTLEGGVQSFEAAFVRTGAAARVELIWQGPGFQPEPLAHQFLGHLPKDRPPQFTRDVQLERGRFAFEELACIRCHKPAAEVKMAKGLVDRAGPNLTDVAKRNYAGWLDAWLTDPAKLRPHTTMPRLFADDDTGKAERYAVVRYLVSIAGRPLPPFRAPIASNDYRQSMDKGRVLFTVTGCAACHTEPQVKKQAGDDDEKTPLQPEDYFYSLDTSGPAAKYNLGALGSKYRPESLAAYLQNPLRTNPSGRMPHMSLSGQEAQDIARYLCRITDESVVSTLPAAGAVKPTSIAAEVFATHGSQPGEYIAFKKLSADAQWIDLGRKLVVTKGCVNCHAIEPGGKPLASLDALPSLSAIKSAPAGAGCLAPKPQPGVVPYYALDPERKKAIAAFLKDCMKGAGSPSPVHSARVALRRFNCLNCHSKDGEGGISIELTEQMRLMARAENADDIRPPLLTGIGHKSRTAWLKSVLTQNGRARPWMQLRMPQYGESNVGNIPSALAQLEGIAPEDKAHPVTLTPAKIADGKAIVGKGGLGCISCHDIAGVPNTGTRGPDLATINQRVRYDWYVRWLHQPLRMAPGTRMPQAFVDDKSTLATVLGGDPRKQADAMWTYLSLGPGLPLPDGMEPPKGLLISVKDRTEVLRTFMPDAGSKAIAVGYQGGVSMAFSADQCRLSYAWAGNFLDASPVWNNRGGSPAKLLGPKFWTAPPGHPWGLTVNPRVAPDFLGRANHPAFGLPFPTNDPPRVYDGPSAVHFDGYSLDKAGHPTFRYTLCENENGAELKVVEKPFPMRTTIASGLTRHFELEAPGGYQTWFLAGTTPKSPRAIPVGGGVIAPNPDELEHVVGVEGVKVILPADDGRAIVLEVFDPPDGTQWRFVKANTRWLAVLRLPESKKSYKASFALRVWGLPKDDDTLLKGLGTK